MVLQKILGWISFLLLTLFSGCQAKSKPHIIVILADDVGIPLLLYSSTTLTFIPARGSHGAVQQYNSKGWNDFSFHGANQIPTPNLDALAYNGIMLNQHYVQPICTPTRAALLTGRYPSNIGMQGIPIGASEPAGLPPGKLLPQYLKDLGYTTRMVGKWHLGFYKPELTPTYRGFDSHLGFYNGLVSYYDHITQDLIPIPGARPESEQYLKDTGRYTRIGERYMGVLNGMDFRRNLETTWEYTGEYATDVLTEESVRVIENHNSSKPLFLYLAHLACHSGNRGKLLEAPQEIIDKFSYITDPDRRTYAAMLWKLDESIGKVVKALKKNGMLDNSIILFSSDNGAPTGAVSVWQNFGSNYPLRGMKLTQWEGGVRSGALVWSPLLKKRQRVSNQLIHVTDWFPTLYHAAGGDLKDLADVPLDGIDQWSALDNNEPSKREEVLLYIDDMRGVASVRSGHWKLAIGNNLNGTLDHHAGDTGWSPTYPDYNVSAVLHSDAGEALASYSNLGVDEILALRSAGTVTCRKPGTHATMCDTVANPDHPCLFNLKSDPCEWEDLAYLYPEQVGRLKKLLKKYESTLVQQLHEPYDVVNADPAKFNYTWSPWVVS